MTFISVRRGVLVLCAVLIWPLTASAQDDHTAHGAAPQAVAPAAGTSTRWEWTAGANAFFGFNYQRRKFRDFNTWESQNWFMAHGRRQVASGTLVLSSMSSLEALTLRDLGSPQVFQTGETFRDAPLIDYQHPHDLFMGLGAEFTRPVGPVVVSAALEPVGSPALGPIAFMHRPSAVENPQAPLSHHHLDSTHITPGVVRGGVGAGPWRVEGSWFRGREPDEDRLDIDLGALDSTSARLSWTRGPWSAQVSAAQLTQPERLAPYDARKLSASVAFTSTGERSIAWLAAFGQNREVHGNLEAYLFEATARLSAANVVYTRIESVAKSILDAGFHPPNTFHRHRQSQVGALTAGYVRDLARTRAGVFGAGGDVTGYLVPSNLREPYGSPVSFHLFLRYRAARPAGTGAPIHVH
jgi:hypothetical protein